MPCPCALLPCPAPGPLVRGQAVPGLCVPPPHKKHMSLPCPPRYVAKLFRDFVFHQVDEEGSPLLDYGLVAESLNKADAGVPEKVRCLFVCSFAARCFKFAVCFFYTRRRCVRRWEALAGASLGRAGPACEISLRGGRGPQGAGTGSAAWLAPAVACWGRRMCLCGGPA